MNNEKKALVRQIKFRGLRVDGKGWVYGDLLQNYIHHKSGATIQQGGCVVYEVIPETVGQFTGLLDKNGKEIYEGDLITCLNSKSPDGVIVWCTSEQMFKIKWISKTYVQVRGQSKYYTENGEKLFANANLVWTVAGSIHEGKETNS